MMTTSRTGRGCDDMTTWTRLAVLWSFVAKGKEGTGHNEKVKVRRYRNFADDVADGDSGMMVVMIGNWDDG